MLRLCSESSCLLSGEICPACGQLTALYMATCTETGQKSAEAIVVTQKRDEGLNTEQGRSLYELA